ncbi:hypothetical protein LPJ78_004014 [Coemansia sp. RSA 989]|nr:hypothetical protein BX667DRAFT_494239 [Coemansia mojavensis]KAJ1741191.1 hypothetical protein LPJ68_003068 [Coemansia sp. RSA 1086]KAJ1749450.1 hypothetical protein LPJ79_003718 [Coemansia sp. RSA 1821]KAJ1863496.1 hypothetical protein LPJ78_004014 [Coemansia sp. RSA 989]KAJ1871394.1 hypothetical protein LPJ55_003930 [Coemansia sp. RSA 990]KAJ2669583.1 hypothetical protein IWW42_004535 [Coemansia sp. RSA 1085]
MSDNKKNDKKDSDAADHETMDKNRPVPLDIPKGESASDQVSNVFDRLVALNMDSEGPLATSPINVTHPAIFRKGTLIDIPDVPPRSPQHRSRRKISELQPRLVAICIKDDAQAEYIINWALENELVLGRDRVVLVNVRQATNGIIGDLTMSNNARKDEERVRSHEMLQRQAIPIKRQGYPIKGVSIRGVDVRGELIRKLIELQCDLAITGSHATKSVRERLTGCIVSYLIETAPCPVLVVGNGMRRYKKDTENQ